MMHRDGAPSDDQSARDFIAGERQWALNAVKAERTAHENSRFHLATSGMSNVPSGGGSGDCTCDALQVTYYGPITSTPATVPAVSDDHLEGFTHAAGVGYTNDHAGRFVYIYNVTVEVGTPFASDVVVHFLGQFLHDIPIPAGYSGNLRWAAFVEANNVNGELAAGTTLLAESLGGLCYIEGAAGGETANLLVEAHIYNVCQCGGGSTPEINASVWGNKTGVGNRVPGTGVDTQLPLGSVTDFLHGIDLTSNTLTIQTAGRYLVGFTNKYDPPVANGYVYGEVRFTAPGGSEENGWLEESESIVPAPSLNDFTFLHASREFELVVGDQLELYARVVNSPATECSVHGNLCLSYLGPTSRTTSMFA